MDVDHTRRRWDITAPRRRRAARELVLSVVLLVVSVMLLGTTAGSTDWKLIIVDDPTIVSSSGGRDGLVVTFLLGGFGAALICFITALRFRGVTRHFRPMAALIGNAATVIDTLGRSALYGGRWEWQVWIIAVGAIGVGLFWLSLLPLSARLTPPDPSREMRGDGASPSDLEVV